MLTIPETTKASGGSLWRSGPSIWERLTRGGKILTGDAVVTLIEQILSNEPNIKNLPGLRLKMQTSVGRPGGILQSLSEDVAFLMHRFTTIIGFGGLEIDRFFANRAGDF